MPHTTAASTPMHLAAAMAAAGQASTTYTPLSPPYIKHL